MRAIFDAMGKVMIIGFIHPKYSSISLNARTSSIGCTMYMQRLKQMVILRSLIEHRNINLYNLFLIQQDNSAQRVSRMHIFSMLGKLN